MAKTVELRRHADADGDVLSGGGVEAALEIGRRLEGEYDLLISSGPQRATQTLACFLAGMGRRQPCGVTVQSGFRSAVEERWFAAAGRAEGRDLEAFRKVDPDLVERRRACSVTSSDRCWRACRKAAVPWWWATHRRRRPRFSG